MINYIVLGIVQGLTEFLPVSSSAHLVFLERIFNISDYQLDIAVILHLGTTLALIIFFYKDVLEMLRDKKALLLILVVTVITGTIGVLGKDFIEGLFSSVKLAAAALIITGLVLLATRKFMAAKKDKINFSDAGILGLTQAIAIIPGISRSGITVSTLLFRGINRQEAFRFSFIAAIPAVLGAALLEAKHIGTMCNLGELLVGFIFSFIFGLLALWIFKKVIDKAKLYYFGYYCIIIAIVVLVFLK